MGGVGGKGGWWWRAEGNLLGVGSETVASGDCVADVDGLDE
jgi:hypothetical protein